MNGHQGGNRIRRELAMQEAEHQQRAERERALAKHPEKQHVEDRLDTAAPERLQESACDDRRRHDERERRDESDSRAQPQPAGDAAHQQQGGDDIEDDQWRFQDRDRRTGDPEEGRDEPRLHAEHVVLIVEK